MAGVEKDLGSLSAVEGVLDSMRFRIILIAIAISLKTSEVWRVALSTPSRILVLFNDRTYAVEVPGTSGNGRSEKR